MKNMDTNAPHVFVDTNILLDYLLFRGDEAMAASYLVDSHLEGQIKIHVAAHSLTNAYFILRKEYSNAERNFIIRNLCGILEIQPISGKNMDKAISHKYCPDLEDALQIQCAVESGCYYLVTRDKELFKNCPVKTLLPHELIRELSL